VTVIDASSLLREGAEAAITPVNNETITAIADWRAQRLSTTRQMVAWTSGLGFKTCPQRRAVWHLHLP